jgi:hypothetical protein
MNTADRFRAGANRGPSLLGPVLTVVDAKKWLPV